MPAYIVRRLPPTISQPGGGAAVALPSGRILARFAATVDSPEALALATEAASRHCRALRAAWHASMIDQHEIDTRAREAAEQAAAEKAWSDEPATVAPEPEPEEVPAIIQRAMGSRYPDGEPVANGPATATPEALAAYGAAVQELAKAARSAGVQASITTKAAPPRSSLIDF